MGIDDYGSPPVGGSASASTSGTGGSTSARNSNSGNGGSSGAAAVSWPLGRARESASGAAGAGADGMATAAAVAVVPTSPPQNKHPVISFRNAAELRQLLQARAAAAAADGVGQSSEEGAGQDVQRGTDSRAGGVAAPPSGTTPSSGGSSNGGIRGGGSSVGSSAPPVGAGTQTASPPPRRFFTTAIPARSSGPGESISADAVGTRSSTSSSNSSNSSGSSNRSSWSGRAGLGTPPPSRAGGFGGKVTHLPWRGTATGRSGDAAARPDQQCSDAGTDGSWDHDKDYNKAKTYSLRLLQRTPLAAADLGRRLQERGHGRQAVTALLTWLADNGALNDALFARLYARSKWVGNLTAPAKIKKDLAAQGVAAAHVAAALTYVFGPSHRIRLGGGHSLSAEEQEVRDLFLETAKKQVQRRSGGGSGGSGSTGGDDADGAGCVDAVDDDDVAAAGGYSDSEREAAAAAFKERDRRRRRLGMWLQYRGHDMDLIIKTFAALRI